MNFFFSPNFKSNEMLKLGQSLSTYPNDQVYNFIFFFMQGVVVHFKTAMKMLSNINSKSNKFEKHSN